MRRKFKVWDKYEKRWFDREGMPHEDGDDAPINWVNLMPDGVVGGTWRGAGGDAP